MEPTNQGETRQEVAKLSQVIQIDEGKIQAHLGEVVRSTVEETLNALLDAEADRLCQAERYERSEARKDTRAGSYQRQLHTKAGEVSLKVPKLRSLPFETAIIERYRRRESSVEEALVEMYLAGVRVRRVEDITEALWGTRVSPSTVSELNQKIYAQIETWRNRPIEGNHPYVFLDGLWRKRVRRHERSRKNFRLPRGGAEHHQTYASTNVRKTLDTTDAVRYSFTAPDFHQRHFADLPACCKKTLDVTQRLPSNAKTKGIQPRYKTPLRYRFLRSSLIEGSLGWVPKSLAENPESRGEN